MTLFDINNNGRSIFKECQNEKISFESQLQIRRKDNKKHKQSENDKVKMSKMEEYGKVNFILILQLLIDLPKEQVFFFL